MHSKAPNPAEMPGDTWPEASCPWERKTAKEEYLRLCAKLRYAEEFHGLLDAGQLKLENCDCTVTDIAYNLRKFLWEDIMPTFVEILRNQNSNESVLKLVWNIIRKYHELARYVVRNHRAGIDEGIAFMSIVNELQRAEQVLLGKKKKSLITFKWKDNFIKVEAWDLIREWAAINSDLVKMGKHLIIKA